MDAAKRERDSNQHDHGDFITDSEAAIKAIEECIKLLKSLDSSSSDSFPSLI